MAALLGAAWLSIAGRVTASESGPQTEPPTSGGKEVRVPIRTPDPSEVRGAELAAQLRQQLPATDFQQSAIFRLRDERGRRREIPLRITSRTGDAEWTVIYEASIEPRRVEGLEITFRPDAPPSYVGWQMGPDDPEPIRVLLEGEASHRPFAGTDFRVCDLGLEFLHWPVHRWIRRERSNGRVCDALDSFPDPVDRSDGSAALSSPYASVRSWMDAEYQALLRAEAYDERRILLKEFSVGSFRKVKTADGEEIWMLRDLRIRDARRDRRTELVYDLP